MTRLPRWRRLLVCGTILALAACAAPAPEPMAQPSAQPSAAASTPTADAHAQADAPAPDSGRLKPRTGGPLPPQVLPAPVKLDTSCTSDADCTVKNVGNCCGEYPACVNVGSPADPAGVQAQCARQGTMSACGFRQIESCSCKAGRCQAQESGGVVR